METIVNLRYDEGGTWSRVRHVWAKGFAFVGDSFYSGADLAECIASFDDLPGALVRLRGHYAMVVSHSDGSKSCVADQVRSFPIFYGLASGRACISDDPQIVAGLTGSDVSDDVTILSFLLQGTTLGARTLFDGVHQVRAGEIVRISTHEAKPRSYLGVAQRTDELAECSPTALREQAVHVVETAVLRMLDSTDRPLVVPLSGGLDSRLIAALIRRSGRTDTVCYSYGSPNSFDAHTSREVARRLGLRWEFVAYSPRKWSDWARSESFRAYRRHASRFCTIEHEQDWPAVLTLKSRKAISEESVFVPGHSGDFLAGSHLPPSAFDNAIENPVEWIVAKYLTLWPTRSIPKGRLRDLQDCIRDVLIPGVAPHVQFDDYGWRQRQAMMIVNSVRVYEHHGFQWRLPLWDVDMLSFWASIPIQQRREKRLYINVLHDLLGDLLDVPFVDENATPRRAAVLARITDGGLYRHAIFSGPARLALLKRISTIVGPLEGIAHDAIRPWRHFPVVRARVNGLLAVEQLVDSLRHIDEMRNL